MNLLAHYVAHTPRRTIRAIAKLATLSSAAPSAQRAALRARIDADLRFYYPMNHGFAFDELHAACARIHPRAVAFARLDRIGAQRRAGLLFRGGQMRDAAFREVHTLHDDFVTPNRIDFPAAIR